jgi:phosphatidylglycerol:prolipoprotein diacylglycerol transferase
MYASIMGLAIAAAWLIARRTQARLPIDRTQRVGIALGAFCGAMIGAKLPFVVADWQGMLSGAAWFGDGKTILTGLVGGYVGVELAKWALDVRVRTGDSFAVPVAVAVGIGRLACFAIGCCYGTPTSLPWGVRFSAAGDSLPRHPTQLYEAAFHLVMAAMLALLQREGIWRGQLIKAYLIAYCAYRFLTEFIRPEARLWLGLTGYQWVTLGLILLFAMLWWRDRRMDFQSVTERLECASRTD